MRPVAKAPSAGRLPAVSQARYRPAASRLHPQIRDSKRRRLSSLRLLSTFTLVGLGLPCTFGQGIQSFFAAGVIIIMILFIRVNMILLIVEKKIPPVWRAGLS